MKIKPGIEKAIEERWLKPLEKMLKESPDKYFIDERGIWKNTWLMFPIGQILLDPKFWQALGKAMGWNKYECSKTKTPCNFMECECREMWFYKMHLLIDNLAQGQSLEEAFDNATK